MRNALEKLLVDFFKSENIKYYASQNIRDCALLYPKKLPEYTQGVVFFAIPYLVRDTKERNVSLYAVPRDYHLYVKELSERFERVVSPLFTDVKYRFFADNSPFCERSCAQVSGLGKRGKNGLLINPEYGSFFFVGCICFSISISITHSAENFKCDLCENCEMCKSACPMCRGKIAECLSAITQKKKITSDEEKIIREHPVKWGCDICQTVCPYNRAAAETPIEFFRKDRIPFLTSELLDGMSDEDFSARAYCWRGREVIKRNLAL